MSITYPRTFAPFALIALLVVFGSLLAGCSGSGKDDSTVQGTYRSAYSIPGRNASGNFDFTVGLKGDATGSFTDANTNATMAFIATFKNDGSFSGSLVDGSNKYPISGRFVKGNGNGGDFRVSINGTDFTGSFTNGGTVTTVTSNFQGYYNGVYNILGLATTGNANTSGNDSFTVDSTGKMTGLLTRGTETALFTGLVSNSGAFSGTVNFSDGALPLSGTIVKTTDNTSVGNFTVTKAAASYPATFGPTTVRQGDSPYRGSYRGTYGMPETGENGNVSMTVSPDGSLTGFFSQTASLPVGTLTGSFNNDGTFKGTVTYPTGSAAPYDQNRAIVGKVGDNLAANGGKIAGDFVLTFNGKAVSGNFQLANGASEPDSIYRASYTDSGYFPDAFSSQIPGGVLSNSPSIEFSVDKEGSLFGSLGTNKIEGRITNDARLVGTITGSDGKKYAMRGIVNKTIWTIIIGYTTAGTPITKDFPGIKADFLIVLSDGNGYTASVKALGGNGKTDGT